MRTGVGCGLPCTQETTASHLRDLDRFPVVCRCARRVSGVRSAQRLSSEARSDRREPTEAALPEHPALFPFQTQRTSAREVSR